MFPIRDTTPRRSVPYVVYALIAANALVFLYEMSLGVLSRGNSVAITGFFYTYGLVPAFYNSSGLAIEAFGRDLTLLEKATPFFTSLFLHGGLMHILGNMWMLYIFGDNVEDWCGHLGFAAFYLAAGAAAGLAHLAFNMGSPVPTIGASGAIAGVMGAYFVLYPRARVVALVPIFFFIQFVELPAWVFLGFWFLLQLLSGTASGAGAVAWWAHIGGFIFGAAVVAAFGKRELPPGARQRPEQRPGKLSDKIDDFWK